MWRVEIQLGTDGRDFALEIPLVADVIPNDCLGDARCLVEVTEVRPEVVVLVEVLLVAFECRMVSCVETDQRREHSYVCKGQLVAGEIYVTAGEKGIEDEDESPHSRGLKKRTRRLRGRQANSPDSTPSLGQICSVSRL